MHARKTCFQLQLIAGLLALHGALANPEPHHESAADPDVLARECPGFHCPTEGGGQWRLHLDGEGQCACEAVFTSGPCAGLSCGQDSKFILVEKDDNTCACENPCEGLVCPDPYFPVIDFERKLGPSACRCDQAAGQEGLHEQIVGLCRSGELAALRQHAPAALRAGDDLGITPLHCACEAGRVEVARWLVQHAGADVDHGDAFGNTALTLASLHGHAALVRALVVELGADVRRADASGHTPLFFASASGNPHAVALLCAHSLVDVDRGNWVQETPVRVACQEGHLAVVEVLADHGADLERPALDGATPFFAACRAGHARVVQFLLGRGVHAARPDRSPWSPFAAACERGHWHVACLLNAVE